MGREQGDHLPEPTIYVGEVDGETVERPAYVPADHVNLQARGWIQKDQLQGETPQTPETPPAAAEGEKPAGRRAPVVSAPSPRVDEGDTPSKNA